MQISILVFDGVTALDVVGPYESLRRLPDVTVRFVAATMDPVAVEGAGFHIAPAADFATVPQADVLIVPGGGAEGLKAVIGDAAALEWIRETDAGTRWTASVCTGALILGGAGLIDGLKVATHWRAKDYLPHFGASYSGERITEHGRLITAAGVSAGIDMGLRLCQLIAGDDAAQAAQLSMEYDPAPPFDAGSPDRAPEHIVEMARGGFGG